ncbi:MAG: hypothetical protein IJ026_07840 [Candidatus Methanomethylophilaceae archaeon]|nr:hypothetical protein [Candidatus Methanomethylophilaceae archaeon]
MELEDDYRELVSKGIGTETSVPDEHVERLAEIFNRGRDYLIAYLTVMRVRLYNPGATESDVMRQCLRMEPELSEYLREVATSTAP